MAKDIVNKIAELEEKKTKLDEQIAALKKAQAILGGSTGGRKPASPAKKTGKKTAKKASRKRARRSRRTENQKAKDLDALAKALPSSADKGVAIRDLANMVKREVDVTLRNDVKELLDGKKIKKVGQRVKTRYYK